MLFAIDRGAAHYFGHIIGFRPCEVILYHRCFGVESLLFVCPGPRYYLVCPD